MGALGTVRGNGDLELVADDPHLRDRRREDPSLGRRRDRLGLRPGGRDRGVVDEGRPAARCDRRSDRGGAAMSGCWQSRSAVAASSIRRSRCSAPTTRRCCAAAAPSRPIRVYAGTPFRLAEHLDRLATSAERIGLPPVNRLELEELARQALEAAGTCRMRCSASSGHRRPTVARPRQRARRPLRRAARAGPAADLSSRRPRRRALAPPRSEVDELRRQHGRRGRGEAPRGRRRGLRRRGRDRAGRADDEHLVASRPHAATRRRSSSASSPA